VLRVSAAATVDLRTTLGAAPCSFDVVDVRGPDAASYLQGQLSQDVEGLEVGATAPTLLLQPTGKLTAWLRVTRLADDAFALVVDVGVGDEVLARLTRFKLRTAAELTVTTRPGLAIRGPGAGTLERPAGALVVPASWPGVEGIDLVAGEDQAEVPVPPGVARADSASLDALRVECGVPAMGAELTEATIPAEGGQWLIDASVSFTKGCYTGQELVARIDSRGGNVPRPVRGLVIDGDDVDPRGLVGAALTSDGSDVGVVTSAARSASLGLVGLATVARSVEVGTVLTVGAGPTARTATLRELPLR
jgi:folate-binding protein YgfZ